MLSLSPFPDNKKEEIISYLSSNLHPDQLEPDHLIMTEDHYKCSPKCLDILINYHKQMPGNLNDEEMNRLSLPPPIVEDRSIRIISTPIKNKVKKDTKVKIETSRLENENRLLKSEISNQNKLLEEAQKSHEICKIQADKISNLMSLISSLEDKLNNSQTDASTSKQAIESLEEKIRNLQSIENDDAEKDEMIDKFIAERESTSNVLELRNREISELKTKLCQVENSLLLMKGKLFEDCNTPNYLRFGSK